MKEDWDKLADEFANHPIALIAEVDCTADEGQPICADFDIQVRTSCLPACHIFHVCYIFLLLVFSHSLHAPMAGLSNSGLW